MKTPRPIPPAPAKKLGNFELADQDDQPRRYRFPKAKVTALAVADQQGSRQLAPWIERLRDRYGRRIDIDGVADVSMIPRFFHPIFRRAFRTKLAYSVMLDWEGSVVNELGYAKGLANIYVLDRSGCILKHVTGPIDEPALNGLFKEIDLALKSPPPQ
jgi:hypothetical protein